jgi:transaldolase
MLREEEMKLFLDSANLDVIREAHRWGVLRVITTNPTIVKKDHRDFLPLVKEICSLVQGEVSVETASDNTEVLIRQAHDIRQLRTTPSSRSSSITRNQARPDIGELPASYEPPFHLYDASKFA